MALQPKHIMEFYVKRGLRLASTMDYTHLFLIIHLLIPIHFRLLYTVGYMDLLQDH